MIDIMEKRKTARPGDRGRKIIQRKSGEREKESKKGMEKIRRFIGGGW